MLNEALVDNSMSSLAFKFVSVLNSVSSRKFSSILRRGHPVLFEYRATPSASSNTEAANRVFSHDVTAAILVSQNNETAAMLVSQTNPLGVELFSYANAFFCSNKFA